nr:Translocon-associated protein subunit beta [Ipomoea batatas]
MAITNSPAMIVALALAALFMFSVASVTASDGPFILAHKKVSLTKLSSTTERVSVSIDIYNRGSKTAYDVTLEDSSWDQEIFYFVTGNTSQSWEKLDVGSVVSHSFELESRVKTTYHGAPALITYHVASKPKLQIAYSTPIIPLAILSEKVVESKLVLNLLGKYGSHVCVVTIVVLFANAIATPSKLSGKKRH